MESTGPGTYRLVLGREIATLLEASKVPRDAVASDLGWDITKLSKVLQGKRLLRPEEVDRLLQLFGASAEDAERIRELGAQARRRGSLGKVADWARQYISLEADATSLAIWNAELIHGMFQTRDYAAAVVGTSAVVAAVDVPRVVDSRMRRRAILERPDGPSIHLIVGEAALRRQVGGRDVLAAQLRYLAELAERPNVTIQVLPFEAGEHPALGTNFTILDVPVGEAIQTWAYLEDLTRADLLDGEQHVNAYRLTFRSLEARATTGRETIALLDSVATDLEKQ